jgi:hypothetical protein
MRAAMLTGVLLLTASAALSAQDAPREPMVNFSLGTGMLILQAVNDGRSKANWDFEPGSQYRASVDKAIGENTYLGASFSSANMPMQYVRMGSFDLNSAACLSKCEAHARVQAFAATIRVLDDNAWHQILEGGVGLSSFGDFREATTGEKLAPLKGDKDMHFNLGYGFGYRPSRSFQASLMADIGFFLHRRSGQDERVEALAPMFMARFMLRAGI